MILYALNFLSIPVYGRFIKNRKRLVQLICLQLFLILSLRAETLGVDLVGYAVNFDAYKELSFAEIIKGFRLFGNFDHGYGFESGFVVLCWITGSLGLSFHGFLVVYAAICLTSVGTFIYRYCKDIPMAFMVFLTFGAFVTFFGILRQSLGLAILLFAIPYLKERKFVKFLILIFIAGLFHSTMWLGLPLYFISKINVTRKIFVLGIFGSLFIIAAVPVIFPIQITPVLQLFSKNYEISGFEWNNMYLIIMFITILFTLMYKFEDKDESVFHWGFLFALMIQSVAFYMPLFSRVSNALFMNFLCVTFPPLINILSKKFSIIVKWLMVILMLALYIYSIDGNNLIPFIPFWSKT